MLIQQLGYESVCADVSTATQLQFEENPHMRLGEADSGHGVIFGNLEGVGTVAVKPHSKLQRGQQEARNLESARRIGLDAVEPVMVAVGGLSNYLITNYRGGLSHLGQTDWAVEGGAPQLETVVEPALAFASHVVAERHNLGVTNLDSQVRNIVSDSSGNPVFIDAEKALFKQCPEDRSKHSIKDVAAIGTSVIHRGLLADKDASYRIDYLDDNVIAPYLDEIKPDTFVTAPEQRVAAIKDRWNDFIAKSKG